VNRRAAALSLGRRLAVVREPQTVAKTMRSAPSSEVHVTRTYASVSIAVIALFSFADRGRPQEAAKLGIPVEVQMRNVNLHLDQSIVLEIRDLQGQMIPTTGTKPVTLDDVTSFVTRIDSAEIALSARSLEDLLNRYVFAYPGAPLKKIAITMEQGRLKQRGVMHKGIDLPFEVEGKLDVTVDGEIRFHVDKVSSAHIPFKGLMHLFREDLSKIINLERERGVTLVGDDILLNPSRMLPPPRIEGRVTAVRIEGDRIVQAFRFRNTKALVPPYRARNYIYHKGGVLRFGKLTMTDADLEVIDQSPSTPFDFSLPDYNRQLVAGYSKNTPTNGLLVFMPDLATPLRSNR
jgi:hypothetical protein